MEREKTQIGNFIVENYELDGIERIKIYDVSHNWILDYQEGTYAYAWINYLLKSDLDLLRTFITMLFESCNILQIDAEFFEERAVLYDKLYKRIVSNLTEEFSDNDEILDELKVLYETMNYGDTEKTGGQGEA